MSSVHFNKEKGSKLKLFTPGPVYVPERILKEIAKPNDTHRSNPYEEMHQLAIEGLRKLLYTKNECLIFTSSASGIMEACIRNLLKDDETGIVISIGAFGDRWHQIGIKNGKNVTKESVEWGKAVTPEVIHEVFSKDNYSVVFLQSNETSTGVYNPLEEIIPIIKEYGSLVCVDATSSMAGIKVEVDKLGIDEVASTHSKAPESLIIGAISSIGL